MLLCTSFLGAWAGSTRYVDQQFVATDGTVLFSCYNVSGNTYCLKLVAQGGMTFNSAYNVNLGVNQTNGAGIGLGNAVWTFSDDKKEAYAEFQTASEESVPTSFYGNYLCFSKTGGTTVRDLVEFSGFNPDDIDWSVTLGDPISVQGVSLPSTSTVKVGKTVKLQPTFNPTNATNKNVTWTTSAESIATVVNGVITGVSAGNANITVKTEDGDHTATCAVTVEAGSIITPAVTPTYPSAQVKPIHSATYSKVAVIQTNGWGSNSTTETTEYGIKVVGNNSGYIGLTDFNYDCSDMEKLHISVWPTNEMTSIRFVPISRNAADDGNQTEYGLEVNNLVADQWNEIEISKSDIPNYSEDDWKRIYQIKFDMFSNQEFWFDNVYFYTTQGSAPVAVTGITVTGAKSEVSVGKTLQLTANVTPANADNKNVTWSSDNDKVTVSETGLVTVAADAAVGSKAVITAASEENNEISGTYNITVAEAPAVEYTVSGSVSNDNFDIHYDAILKYDGSVQITITNFVNKNGKDGVTKQICPNTPSYYEFNSNNIASVPGTYTEGGTFAGFFYIPFAGGADRLDVSFALPTATPKVEVTGLTLSNTALNVRQGNDVTLTATIVPADADVKTVTWSTSNEAIATVSNGVVHAVTPGDVTITATSTDNPEIKATCTVTVLAPVAATGVTLNLENIELYSTYTSTLVATVAPADAANKVVNWNSSNDAVATVVNGVVTGVAKGTAVITATTADGGFTATCNVNVLEPARPTKAEPTTVTISDIGLRMTYYVSNDAGRATIHIVGYENTNNIAGMVIADTNPVKTLDGTPAAGSVVSTTYHFASSKGDHWIDRKSVV